jgi:hypothetical protein
LILVEQEHVRVLALQGASVLQQKGARAISDPATDALDADEAGGAVLALGLQESDHALALDVTNEPLTYIDLDQLRASEGSSYGFGS